MKQCVYALLARLKALPFHGRRLVAFCYAAFLVGSVLACLLSAAQDSLLRATGQLVETTLSMEDFELIDLAQVEGDLYVSESYDPRMILQDTPLLVRRITINAQFLNKDPGEFCVFYKTSPTMEEFDANYRVWAHQEDDGRYTFDLPAKKIYGLRIDPGIYSDMEIVFERIVLNEPQSLLSRFTPTRPWLLALLIAPPLAASVVQYLACVCRRLASSKKHQ